MDMLYTLEALCALPGVSGDEGAVRDYILQQLHGVCDCRVDALGNVIAFRKGRETPRNKVMFSAHMDEVGLIVTFIEDSGLLRFAAVGGLDSRVVIGTPVEVGDARVPGVIGTKAVHLQEEKERAEAVPLEKLYIDIGAASREEARALVAPGDRAVFHAPFGQFGDGRVFGRALDDRAGCALLLLLLQEEPPFDLHAVFTVQEEVGSAGARAAAFALQPDISVVVETTTASDIAGVSPDKQVCHQGRGPVLSFMDRGAVYDQALYGRAMVWAEQAGIPCQCKAGVYGGNESHAIQPTAAGVRVIGVSMPCRYIHSPTAVLKTEDMEHTLQLLRLLLERTAQI